MREALRHARIVAKRMLGGSRMPRLLCIDKGCHDEQEEDAMAQSHCPGQRTGFPATGQHVCFATNSRLFVLTLLY